MIENRVMFYKSHIPEEGMEAISYVNHIRSFKNMNHFNKSYNKYRKINKLCYHTYYDLKFKEIQNIVRQSNETILNFIFLPPGFSYLFSHYDTFTCKLTEDLSKLLQRYSYNKSTVITRCNMDPIDEEVMYGYISGKKET